MSYGEDGEEETVERSRGGGTWEFVEGDGAEVDTERRKYKDLAQIAESPGTWLSRGKIFELVNHDGGEPIGNTITLYDELKELIKKGVIQEKQEPHSNRLGYFITTREFYSTIPLPHPSEMEDPIFRKSTIKVWNPITGETEEV